LEVELDKGEAEALVQGQEKRAKYFVGDERRAREISKGTAWPPWGQSDCWRDSTSRDKPPTRRLWFVGYVANWSFASQNRSSRRPLRWRPSRF